MLGLNGQHFADYVLKCIFLYENIRILMKILLKFILKSPLDNMSVLIQMMVWCWNNDGPVYRYKYVTWLWGIMILFPKIDSILSFIFIVCLICLVFPVAIYTGLSSWCCHLWQPGDMEICDLSAPLATTSCGYTLEPYSIRNKYSLLMCGIKIESSSEFIFYE